MPVHAPPPIPAVTSCARSYRGALAHERTIHRPHQTGFCRERAGRSARLFTGEDRASIVLWRKGRGISSDSSRGERDGDLGLVDGRNVALSPRAVESACGVWRLPKSSPPAAYRWRRSVEAASHAIPSRADLHGISERAHLVRRGCGAHGTTIAILASTSFEEDERTDSVTGFTSPHVHASQRSSPSRTIPLHPIPLVGDGSTMLPGKHSSRRNDTGEMVYRPFPPFCRCVCRWELSIRDSTSSPWSSLRIGHAEPECLAPNHRSIRSWKRRLHPCRVRFAHRS